MSKKLKKELDSRFRQLKNDRTRLDDTYEKIARYVMPRYADIDGADESYEQYGKNMYDTTAANALMLRSNALVGYMMSPGAEWFRMFTEDMDLMDDKELGMWLQRAEQGIYSALTRSNFYDTMQVAIEIADGFGTACVWPEEDEENKRIIFTPIDPGQAYVSYDKYNNIDTFCREFKIPARVLEQRFDELPRSISTIAKGANPYGLVTVRQMVMQRADLEDAIGYTLDLDKEKPFVSVWCTADDMLGEPMGFYEFPVSVWRPERVGAEAYGRSVTMRALPTIQTVNLIAKDLLKASQQAVRPPMQAPATMKGKVNMLPGKVNYYQSPNELIQPIQYGNYPFGVEELNLMRQQIIDLYQVDAFLMLSNNAKNSNLTATQVMEMQSEKAVVLGPMIARLQADFLDGILSRVLNIEMRAMRIPAPPPRVAEMLAGEGGAINVDYLGPLSMAQKTLHETMGNRRAIESVMPLFSIVPSIGDRVDWDNLAEQTLIANGMKREFIRDDNEVQDIRNKRAQEQAMQNAAAQAESMAKTTKDLAQANSMAQKGGGMPMPGGAA